VALTQKRIEKLNTPVAIATATSFICRCKAEPTRVGYFVTHSAAANGSWALGPCIRSTLKRPASALGKPGKRCLTGPTR
jgi:hypothetical protein